MTFRQFETEDTAFEPDQKFLHRFRSTLGDVSFHEGCSGV